MEIKDIAKFKTGEVLVTDMTDPDWEPIMKIAGAIVTDKGGRTCHAAIISREMGIPCVVGTNTVSQRLKPGGKSRSAAPKARKVSFMTATCLSR